MRREDFPVLVKQPVHWGDMDAFQHVNNTVYFRWFEDARIAYFGRMRILESGAGPILASTSCRYKAPLVFPDSIEAGARVVSIGEDRFTMELVVFSESLGREAAVGDAVMVSYDYAEKRKVPLPDAWRRAIAEIEGREIER